MDSSPFRHDKIISRIREGNPSALVIDLDRLFSHGHAVAVMARGAKSTCHIPLVFAGGVAEKVARLKREFPGAVFTDWAHIAAAVGKALSAPPMKIQPKPYMERFAGSSLVKKLGIKENQRVALLGAPDGFEEQLGDLPDAVEFQTAMNRTSQLVLWFVRSFAELEREAGFLAARLPQGVSVWIVYPKQTSRFKVDFNQGDVRRTALSFGLVDYKICAVDSDWTGLKFARKKQ